jgi:hypothetical protein
MDTARSYTRLALDCLKIAERAHDPATRNDMTRLAPFGRDWQNRPAFSQDGRFAERRIAQPSTMPARP